MLRIPPATAAALLSCIVLGVFTQPVVAQLPYVRFDRMFPLGGAAGTSVVVEIAGADIEEVKSLLFDHPGLKSEPIEGKPTQFRISIAEDVPTGTYDVRLVGRFGVSNPRLFAVSRGLQELTEIEPNNEPSRAHKVPMNSATSGMSDGNGEDWFRFTGRKGQRVMVDCQAGKLDSMLDATLVLSAASSAVLASNSDYHGRDPAIDFIVPEEGEYLVTVSDLSYRGGFPYRLVITDRPQVENVFPRAVQVGAATELIAFGRNLGPDARRSQWTIADLPLEEIRFHTTPPRDVLTSGFYRFIEHPTDHSVLPTAATCTLYGYQVIPPGADSSAPVTLLAVDSPVSLEAEPNDTPDKAQPITLPAVVSGRFDQPRDADWYEFEAAEAGPYAFDVYCERIAGQADPYLVVADDQGNRITELDDFGHRVNAFDGHLRDPSGSVNLAAGRKYRVLVQDRYRRGGARYQYVLAVRKAVPDFFVASIHSQNPGPAGTTIWRGGAAHLDVIIHQASGFNGPVTITAENLPAGLHANPTTINNSTLGAFVLWADADAPEWTGVVNLIATGTQGDRTIRREVRPYTRVWTEANISSSRPTRDLTVAVREKCPFELSFDTDHVVREAGKQAELKLQVKRLWPDFKGKITIQPLAFPGGFSMPNSEFAAEQTELPIAIQIPAGTRPGDYTLTVLAQGQVPYNKDPKATARPNALVSLPSVPVTISVVSPKQ